jgi:hypothetical protein
MMKITFFEICSFWSQALQIIEVSMYTFSALPYSVIPRFAFGCFISMDLATAESYYDFLCFSIAGESI